VNASCIEPEGVYIWADLLQASCISKTLKKITTENPNQEETIDIENQDLLKAWTLSLIEKANNVRKKFVKQTNLRQDC
jgi:hypothetical protein